MHPRHWPLSTVWRSGPSKVRYTVHTKIGENEVFFAQNQFSWPNGQLLPKAYHTYSESYCSDGLFGNQLVVLAETLSYLNSYLCLFCSNLLDGGKQRLQQRLFSPTLTMALN